MTSIPLDLSALAREWLIEQFGMGIVDVRAMTEELVPLLELVRSQSHAAGKAEGMEAARTIAAKEASYCDSIRRLAEADEALSYLGRESIVDARTLAADCARAIAIKISALASSAPEPIEIPPMTPEQNEYLSGLQQPKPDMSAMIPSAPEPRDQVAEDEVFIYSREHFAYWRPGALGYTQMATEAGRWPRSEAERMTAHCGPEKQIELRSNALDAAPSPSPGLAAQEVERLKAIETAAEGVFKTSWRPSRGAYVAVTEGAFDDLTAALSAPSPAQTPTVLGEHLCEGCPPANYPTDVTRCAPCPRRPAQAQEIPQS